MLSRNHVIDPVQPTRSAITVPGRSGYSASNAATNGSKGMNAFSNRARSYRGGPLEATAFAIVPLQVELLNRRRWTPRIELANAIFEYLEIFHNRQRRHSSLGYLTPIQFENNATPVA